MLDSRILKRPFFYDWANDGNMIYFSMCYYNALCIANLNNDQVKIIATFPDVPYEKGNEYFGMYKYENYLLLGPGKSTDDFLVYDISNSQFLRIPNKGENFFYSFRTFEEDRCLYIVSEVTAEINRIDFRDFSVKRMICKEFDIDNAQVVKVIRVGDLIYIPLNQKKKLLIFSMEKQEFRYCEFPSNISFISTIDYYNDRFWITGETKTIYAWNIHETKAQEVASIPDDIKLFYTRNIWFGNSFIDNGCLWLFPAYADSILKYNILTGELKKFKLVGEEESAEQIEEELKGGRRFATKYGIVKKYNNRVFFLSSKTRIFYELDLLTSKVCRHDFQMINLYNNQIYPPGEMSEIQCGLDGLIRAITGNITNVETRKEMMIGKTIYNSIN